MRQNSSTLIVETLNDAPQLALEKINAEKSLLTRTALPKEEQYLFGHKVMLDKAQQQILALTAKETMVRDYIEATRQVRKLFEDKCIEVQAITPMPLFQSILQTCNLLSMNFAGKSEFYSHGLFLIEDSLTSFFGLYKHNHTIRHDVPYPLSKTKNFNANRHFMDDDIILFIGKADAQEQCNWFRSKSLQIINLHNHEYAKKVFEKIQETSHVSPPTDAGLGDTKLVYSLVAHNFDIETDTYQWYTWFTLKEMPDILKHFYHKRYSKPHVKISQLPEWLEKINVYKDRAHLYSSLLRTSTHKDFETLGLRTEIVFPEMPTDIQEFLFDFKTQFPHLSIHTAFDPEVITMKVCGKPVEQIAAERLQWWQSFVIEVEEAYEKALEKSRMLNEKLDELLGKEGILKRRTHFLQSEADIQQALRIEKDPIFWTPYTYEHNGMRYELAVIFKSVGLTDNEAAAIQLIKDAEPKLFMGVKAN
jgi:hypothetical protein